MIDIKDAAGLMMILKGSNILSPGCNPGKRKPIFSNPEWVEVKSVR